MRKNKINVWWSQLVAYGTRTLKLGNEFASRFIEELRALTEDKEYDTTDLEGKDFEKIVEWVRSMPHQPTWQGKIH